MIEDVERVPRLLTAALLRDLGDEVDLVFRYGSRVRGSAIHRYSDVDISYVPVHEETSHALTVIVGQTMCDLYPITWGKLERMAELDDPSASILLAARVTHRRSDASAERFERIQARLRENLLPPARPRMLARAFQLFEQSGYSHYLLGVQATRGHRFACLFHGRQIIAGVLHAVAVANQRCVDTRRIDEVVGLERLPDRFGELIRAATTATSPAEVLAACEELLGATRDFLLAEQREVHRGEASFGDALDAAYPELMGDLHHAMVAAEESDPWRLTVVPLSHELMVHIAQARTGVEYSSFNSPPEYEQDLGALGFPDLVGRALALDFEGVRHDAPAFGERLRSYLLEHGVELNAFETADELREFLDLPAEPAG